MVAAGEAAAAVALVEQPVQALGGEPRLGAVVVDDRLVAGEAAGGLRREHGSAGGELAGSGRVGGERLEIDVDHDLESSGGASASRRSAGACEVGEGVGEQRPRRRARFRGTVFAVARSCLRGACRRARGAPRSRARRLRRAGAPGTSGCRPRRATRSVRGGRRRRAPGRASFRLHVAADDLVELRSRRVARPARATRPRSQAARPGSARASASSSAGRSENASVIAGSSGRARADAHVLARRPRVERALPREPMRARLAAPARPRPTAFELTHEQQQAAGRRRDMRGQRRDLRLEPLGLQHPRRQSRPSRPPTRSSHPSITDITHLPVIKTHVRILRRVADGKPRPSRFR